MEAISGIIDYHYIRDGMFTYSGLFTIESVLVSLSIIINSVAGHDLASPNCIWMCIVQRETAVTAYLESKQLLLFTFAREINFIKHYYYNDKPLVELICIISYQCHIAI